MGAILIAVVADVVVVAAAMLVWHQWGSHVRRFMHNRTPSSRPNR
jgi:hypothetical protein